MAEAPQSDRYFVLLMGRNPVFRNVLAAILTEAGYSVLTCVDHVEAAALLRNPRDHIRAIVFRESEGTGVPPFPGPVIPVTSALAEKLVSLSGDDLPEELDEVLRRLETTA